MGFVSMPFMTPKCPSFPIEVARKWHDMYVHLLFGAMQEGSLERRMARTLPTLRLAFGLNVTKYNSGWVTFQS